MDECQEVIEDLPIFEAKNATEKDHDSGLDNASDSGGSCDDDRKIRYSSNDSLETDPPFLHSSPSVRAKVQNFLDGERLYPIIKQDLPPACPHRVSSKPECQTQENSIAILDMEAVVLDDSINDEAEIDLDKLPPYFQELWLGRMNVVDYEQDLNVKPSWFDEDKFKRGQKFAREHLFCINYAEMVSLYLIFALKSALQPLIYTGRSDTPFKAFQRYLSTLTRIMSWYEGDVWSEGSTCRRNIEVVRMMHKNIYQKLNSASSEELRQKTSVMSGSSAGVWCTSREVLLDDFKSACPVPAPGSCPYAGAGIWVNQCDMAVTQFAFVGLAVTFPAEFGMHFASDEDLDGFIHLWRVLGHFMGINDKYNYCNSDLETVRQRTHDFISIALKPSLRDVTPDWEHMCRCLTEGIAYYVPGVNFEASLRHISDILHIHTPRLAKSLTYWQSFMYNIICFTFRYMFRFPGMLSFHNRLLYKAIEKAQKASKETLQRWEKKEFPYMKQDNRTSINIP